MSAEDLDGNSSSNFHVERGPMNVGPGSLTTGPITYNNNYLVDDRIKELRLEELLSFPGLLDRERAIGDASEGTCRWFTDTSQYHAWASQPLAEWHHGLLWLKGKAGAGKSTIMKTAVKLAERTPTSDGELVLPHFFNARGVEMQRSAEGMYRTLLVWLLKQLPLAVKKDLQKRYGSRDTHSWPVAELERFFKDAISRIGTQSVSIYVDALDECSKQDVRRMLRIFRDTVKDAWNATPRRQVRVLFASRPHPHTTFNDAIYMDLGDQEEHIRDITRYINSALSIGDGESANAMRQALLRKADGVFMWAVLVVEALNDDYDGGIVKLEQRLREFPAGLHKLYRYTLDQYPEDRDELRACLRWLLFGTEPRWEIEQLWWAIQLSLGRSNDEICREYEIRTAEDIARYITRVSKGLIECRYVGRKNEKGWPDNNYRVQLVHESVRDFVLSEVELRDLFGVENRQVFEAQCHEHLRDACYAELLARNSQLPKFLKSSIINAFVDLHDLGWLPKKNYFERSRARFPMAPYAANGAIWHAEEAQRCGHDQKAFVATYGPELGPVHIVMRSPNRLSGEPKWTILHSVLSLLLHQNCHALIRETQFEFAMSSRAAGKSFLIADEGRNKADWAYLASWLESSFEPLCDICMRLEQWHPDIKHILDALRLSSLRLSSTFNPRWFLLGIKHLPLIKVGANFPSGASFFLLTSTSSKRLEPHISSLKQIFQSTKTRALSDADHAAEDFLRLLLFFILQNLASNLLDFTNAQTRASIAKQINKIPRPSNEAYVCARVIEIVLRRTRISLRTAQIIREIFPSLCLEALQRQKLLQATLSPSEIERDECDMADKDDRLYGEVGAEPELQGLSQEGPFASQRRFSYTVGEEDEFDDMYLMSGGKIAWAAC